MHDIIVLENLCFLPSTRKREVGVFKSLLWGPLSGDLFFWCPKRPFSCGRKAKNTLIRVDRALNSCSQMLRLYGYAANKSTLYEQNISSARASPLFVFCFVFRCTTWNFLMWRFVEHLESIATKYCYWIRMLSLEFKSRKFLLLFLIRKTLHKRHKGLKESKFISFNHVFDSEA